MRKFTKDEFDVLLKQVDTIKPRFKRDLRFTVSTSTFGDETWAEREIVAVYDKSKNTGVVLLQPYDKLYIVAFEAGGMVREKSSGRSKAIICDFCFTWRAGGESGLITFYADSQARTSTAQLCCLDLACSEHVRTLTSSSLMSRAQLREHLSNDERVARLKIHLQAFIDKLDLQPIE